MGIRAWGIPRGPGLGGWAIIGRVLDRGVGGRVPAGRGLGPMGRGHRWDDMITPDRKMHQGQTTNWPRNEWARIASHHVVQRYVPRRSPKLLETEGPAAALRVLRGPTFRPASKTCSRSSISRTLGRPLWAKGSSHNVVQKYVPRGPPQTRWDKKMDHRGPHHGGRQKQKKTPKKLHKNGPDFRRRGGPKSRPTSGPKARPTLLRPPSALPPTPHPPLHPTHPPAPPLCTPSNPPQCPLTGCTRKPKRKPNLSKISKNTWAKNRAHSLAHLYLRLPLY